MVTAKEVRTGKRTSTLYQATESGLATLRRWVDALPVSDQVSREGTFLRYTANVVALQELLGFLYAECCTRNKAIKPKAIMTICH